MSKVTRIFFAAALILIAVPLLARSSSRKPFSLKFNPQEGVQSTTLDLEPAFLERAVEIRVEDGRKLPDAAVVGSGTDDDDKKFPIKTDSDLIAYLKETLVEISQDWGLKTEPPADRILTVGIARFFVDESNKAVGSVYTADVKLTFKLTDAKGRLLDEGSSNGEATRYGRAGSADNYNEVLSDALKEAFAGVLADNGLQTAWVSGKLSGTTSTAAAAPKTEAPKESVEERLKKLDDLLKRGVITKEEHQKKRAEILKEL